MTTQSPSAGSLRKNFRKSLPSLVAWGRDRATPAHWPGLPPVVSRPSSNDGDGTELGVGGLSAKKQRLSSPTVERGRRAAGDDQCWKGGLMSESGGNMAGSGVGA
jgi:hypothetical protein